MAVRPAPDPGDEPLALRLDRESPVPLYYQIATQLEAVISGGGVRPGWRLPSEMELAQRLAVSRPTVRQAIDRLLEQGLVARRRGIGTCVVPRRIHRALQLTSLHDDLTAAGRRPSTRVIALATVRADDLVAHALGVSIGTPVAQLDRLRRADGAPLAVMRNYFAMGLVPADTTTLEADGLYALFRTHGLHPRVAEQTVGARGATAAEARLLEVPRGHCLLTMTRTAFDAAGLALEHGVHCYRADRYVFETRLVSR